ncbi:hypothetical protein DAEQUDRAFT_470797 [Daedalea quercina L-15889]|uniref:Uncharacterized protein n=1 Tax=Daedalea quercina L-15889 TaxID=1314783 RepID=A0A165THF0_9APHY|nr:hypothetical protein DAEQUDRAFT_470797 [Daedalea quercina L-15889]
MSATHTTPSRIVSLPAAMSPPLSTSSTSTRSSYSFSPLTPSSLTPTFALKKKASLHSHRSYAHSHKLSISAESTSSGSTSQSFGTSLIEAYTEWKEADDALQRLQLEERDRDECNTELASAKEAMRRLTVQHDASRSPAKRRISRKPSALTLFFKHNKSSAHLPFQDVPPPDTTAVDVTEASVRVTELERETARRTKQVRAPVEETRRQAAALDACYDRLRKMIDNGPLPSWRFDEGNETAILRAEKTVTARERSYEDYVTQTEVLKRARLAIQSAHHHYTESMNLLDTVCSPSRSGFMAALSDEQSKADAYRGVSPSRVAGNQCS